MAETTVSARELLRRPFVWLGAWMLVCGLALATIASFERSARLADLTAESERLPQRSSRHFLLQIAFYPPISEWVFKVLADAIDLTTPAKV